MPRIKYRPLRILAFIVEWYRQAGTPVAYSLKASDDTYYLLARDNYRYILIQPLGRRVSIIGHNAFLP
jgi:hypothetical protein